MSEQKMSEQLEWRGSYQGTSNITALRALYSIKNRKFIKGYLDGHRGKGEIIYRLYPGTYIYLFYFGWNKSDPPHELKAELLRLEKQGEQVLAKVVIKFYKPEFLKNFPPQLLDFYNAKPSYHGYPAINFNKVYSEEENKALLDFVNQNKEFLEGAEYE
jgi:hypothetical protein